MPNKEPKNFRDWNRERLERAREYEAKRTARRKAMLDEVLGQDRLPILDANWELTDLANRLRRIADDDYELMALCKSERPVYGLEIKEATDRHGDREYRVAIFGLDGRWVYTHDDGLMGLYTTDLQEADEYFQWALTEAEYKTDDKGFTWLVNNHDDWCD